MGFVGTIGWILTVAGAIWVIYDVWTKNKKDSQGIKIVWTICAIIQGLITAIVYYIMRKQK